MTAELFTRGKGPYGRTYEKLRKRSLRERNRNLKRIERFWPEGIPWSARRRFVERHVLYVMGVRDALAEVERINRGVS